MATHFNKEFHMYVASPPEKLAAFWQTFLRSDYGRRLAGTHPAVLGRCIDDLAYLIPIVLHGDAAPFSKKKSAMFVQWGSLLGLQVQVFLTQTTH